MGIRFDSDPEEVAATLKEMKEAWAVTQNSMDCLKALDVLDLDHHRLLAKALHARATLIWDLNDIFPGLFRHLNGPEGFVASKFVEDFRENLAAAFHAADLLDDWLDRFFDDADFIGCS
jgi:hypothetical protein